ncbi:PR domain zinc finger protein 5-like [Toxorhynchites rutilus septentrionalis]|uniref:PR domain zinc finger protein 5-like n=1 Tax=Toxorhynchites rutilus septentrionalis TaxID=329112 RepID=UPI00247AE696|nr:PR domain zinc finger protein 5-like [Toxorhynchites rutilus septentrionalis]
METCCRICLESHKTLLSLQTEIEFEGNSMICSEMYYKFTGLQDSSITNSNVSKKICIACFTELNSSFKFQQKAIESFKSLSQLSITRTFDDNSFSSLRKNVGDKLESHVGVENELPESTVTCDKDNSNIKADDVYVEEYLDEECTFDDEKLVSTDNCISSPQINNENQIDHDGVKMKADTKHGGDDETESDKNDQGYNCEYCSRKLNSQSELESHFVSEHCQQLSEDEFVCTTCDKRFKTRKTLRQHCRIHYDSRRFRCSFCSKTFNYGHHLRIHSTTHTMDKPFSCEFCGKQFASKDRLKNHELQHKDERKYNCEACDSLFRSKKALKMHAILKHDAVVNRFDSIQCDKCSKTLFSKSAATAHFKRPCGKDKIAEDKNDNRQWKQKHICDICGMFFRQSIMLKRHSKTHKGPKTSSCIDTVAYGVAVLARIKS